MELTKEVLIKKWIQITHVAEGCQHIYKISGEIKKILKRLQIITEMTFPIFKISQVWMKYIYKGKFRKEKLFF